MYTTIGELSRQVGRSVQTLRRLERLGRIPKASREPLTRRRIWAEQDAATVRAILGTRESAKSAFHPVLEEAERLLESEEGKSVLRRVKSFLAGGEQ